MTEGISPIRPEQVGEVQLEQIPDVVIETFNGLIAQNSLDGHAKVEQDAVVEKLIEAGLNRDEIFENHWLDVEDLYRAAGWDVKYDKPMAYGGDTHRPFFVFSTSAKKV